MPRGRPKGSRNKKQAVTIRPIADDVPPPELTTAGKELIREVTENYQLCECSQRLLRLAAESLSQSERCAAQVRLEGFTYVSPTGLPKKTPAAELEIAYRNASVVAIGKLMATLEQ